ncbi:FkbM family methyltransferase [Urechidicola sp. KH5]
MYKRVFKPFKLFKGVVLRHSINGINYDLHIDDWIQSQLYFLNEYEMPEIKALGRFLNDGDVFVDIGANIGLFTLNAANLVGEFGSVIAFEPFKMNWNSLKKNVLLNRYTNIKIENFAIGEKNGEISLFYDDSESNLGMVSFKEKGNSIKENIESITLDTYIKNHSITKVDFIKLDIEGGEFNALKGMIETLNRFKPTLLIEILNDEFYKDNNDSIENFLSNLGYSKFFIDDEGDVSKKQKELKRENYIFSQ